MSDWDIYALVDSYEFAVACLRAGIKVIQYREKYIGDEEYARTAKKIQQACAGKASFIINDRLAIARELQADGVQLGQNDQDFRQAIGEFAFVGVSTHSVEQALRAEKDGATYIGIGPVFVTINKPEEPAIGLGVLKKVVEQVKIPIVAIGGITEDNLPQVVEAGARKTAFIGELKSAFEAGNLSSKVASLRGIISNNL